MGDKRGPGSSSARRATVLIVLGVLLASCATAAASGRVAGAGPAYLPDHTCRVVDRESDDPVAFQPPDAPVVKVIYAHPSDFPSRFAEIAPTLVEGVREIVEYLYLESGDRKSVRFDLGTRFGPDCVDLQRVSLPRPASSYVDPSTGTEDAGPLIHDLRPRLGAQPGVRIYLVYVEIENRAAGGLASIIDDDTPTGASHAIGDRFAFVFSPVSSGDIDPQHMAAASTHEVFHLLGAVQKSAPNHGSSGRGHCDDSSVDLMCRGGTGCELRQHTTTVLLFPLDCNGDDYFNPDPPPGSYLATHWNTYNSPFLCAIGTCVPDNVGPSTKVKGPRRTSDRTPTFNLRADEPEVEFECRIDKGKRRSCGKRFVTPKLEPGKHKLAVTAIDQAGNADPTPDVRRFEITD